MIRLRRLATRHAPAVAALVLVLSVVGTVVALVASRHVVTTPYLDGGDLVYVACQVLPYGVAGAVLVLRRPDLPFGWLLSLAAMSLVVALALAGPAVIALEQGGGGRLALWGLTASALMFVPVALEGIINVRFPSGTPTGRWGRALERAIVLGIVVGVLAGVLGESTVRAFYPSGHPAGARRVVDGTGLAEIADQAIVAVPIVILLGVLAGIGVVVRFVGSEGLQRQQLRWRAVGVIGALALYPLVVTESLPGIIDDVVADVEPLWFVATLAIPVLRYDLWAIDSIVRRSASAAFASSLTPVESLVRVAAEMLRLPYVAVVRDGRVLASAGEESTAVERWPVTFEGETVGVLVASPRHGFDAVAAADRQVLATIAQIVGGSVRAEALTAELLDARHRLVTAGEEERRRLRRDLHDGLGPLLTGLGLNLDAAASRLENADARAADYLANARHASSEVIASLRDVVDGLRPPALDELGLAGALKIRLEALAADAGLALDLRLPESGPLPAAVEVAAYRTAVEAVTNAARHAAAHAVRVEVLESAASLTVTVLDDGTATAAWSPGVGLTGMRERAEEIGGTLEAGPTPDGGRVRASYPLGGIR